MQTRTLLKYLVACLCGLYNLQAHAAETDTLRVDSPSGRIEVRLWLDSQVHYSIWYDRLPLMAPSVLGLELTDGRSMSGRSLRIRSVRRTAADDTIRVPVPEKRRLIRDRYHQLTLQFRDPFTVYFRVYDDGAAYRIGTRFRDSITIRRETARFVFPGHPSVYFPAVQKRDHADIFHTSYEENYPLRRLDSLPPGTLGYSPVLVVPADGRPRIGLTESDLLDYPGMFLAGTGSGTLEGVCAPYPLEEQSSGGLYPQWLVSRRASYIARTAGTRNLPWRVFIVAPEDRDLPGNDLVYRLATPSRIGDASWVHPGNLTDEWIVDINLFGVPFRAGLNTNSYLYYIDFAKRFGFDRIMMDAGWSDNTDLFRITPSINLDSILDHARRQGVRISMWTLAQTLDRQLDSALDRFQRWGVDFIMTDFIDRDDQKTVRFYQRIAEACARRRIMIMFHGAYPPKGFNRTYPNAVTREGVLGSEYNIWSDRVTPAHDLTLPFTRMLAGSMDYEPGLLHNATRSGTRPVAGEVTSPGTRCHQVAMFVVYDSPMQIFSGNPSEGQREPDLMHLIGSLPTTWDDTRILQARVAEYIVTARLKDGNWYVAGMNDWTPRDLEVPLDFLQEGTYAATICRDGINADRYAADYSLTTGTVLRRQDTLTLHLAPGGGFLVKLEKRP
ncbi:MAG TPA: glycoside hydrolase family 97 protein [Chitinophagaceae bacterium]|nr:glycoside hydrolase family 97 protein [Chitinophagaceae bacterium]